MSSDTKSQAERERRPKIIVGAPAAWRWLQSQNDGARQETAPSVAAADAFVSCLLELQERAVAFNLSPEAVHLASEIAALEPGLNVKQRLALIVLGVISLAALNQGSSRFPIDASAGGQALRPIAAALCGKKFIAAGLADISGEIESLLESRKDLSVIGRDPLAYTPLLYLKPYIYHQRVYHAELSLAERFSAILSGGVLTVSEPRLEAVLQDVLRRPTIGQGGALALSEEQKAAVSAVATHRVTIISGGPGTGKTSIVATMLRMLARIGVNAEKIALAAPTGKAAYRMGEALDRLLGTVAEPDEHDISLRLARPKPQTLHRLLAYSPSRGRFRYHHNNPLPASVVVVDEVSMVDLDLMRGLADAISDNARLVLIGDEEQLPSVAAGAVFRDLIQVGMHLEGRDQGSVDTWGKSPIPLASVKLRRNYRVDQEKAAGQAVAAFAQAINAGMPVDNAEQSGTNAKIRLARRASPAELAYRGVELLRLGASDLDSFLDRWYEDQVLGDAQVRSLARNIYRLTESDALGSAEADRLRPLFTHLQSSRILCATRVFSNGSERVNAILHARAAGHAGRPPEQMSWLPGEPIMALHNDYTRGLFNGDQGLVLQVRRAPTHRPFLAAVFQYGDILKAFPLETLRTAVELCYAMTVHKAQGSEFDHVALILPDDDLPLLTRELLYTALTRARSSVVLVGEEELIRTAARRKIERFSGLADHLVGMMKKGQGKTST
jgi:exodeoxyribonuclease V alpha subunit